MANNTDWLNISQMTGGTGETALSLTALTNNSLQPKTATITARNSQYNVSDTTTVTIQGFQPTLTLSRSTLRFDSTGGTATFTVYSNTAWTINFPAIVHSYSTSAGTGDTEVTVVLAPNPDEVAKVDTGIVKDVFNVNQLYLTIVQESFIVELYVEPTDDIVFKNTGSTTAITIDSNADWELEYPSWVTPSITSGESGTTTVTFTAGQNGPTDRSGEITVYAGSKYVTINVFQPLYIPPYITVTPSAYTFSYTASSAQFVVDSFPEWTAEVISTGETHWGEDIAMVVIMEITEPNTTVNLGQTGVLVNGVKVPGSTYTFAVPGTYSLNFPYIGSTTVPFLADTPAISVDLLMGFETIPERCFANCTGLTSITIPNTITGIGSWAFSGCSSLPEITIPDSVTSIGTAQTFYGCSSLTAVTLPSGLTGNMPNFRGCTSLTEIAIPSGITYVGNNTFWGCSSLMSISAYSITAPGTPDPYSTGTDKNPFEDMPTGGTLYYPIGSDYSSWLTQTGGNLSNYYLPDWNGSATLFNGPIYISDSAITQGYESGTTTIIIGAKEPWTIISNEDWISFSQTSGSSGLTEITVTISGNTWETETNMPERTATIEVTDGTHSEYITITQEGVARILATYYLETPGTIRIAYNRAGYGILEKVVLPDGSEITASSVDTSAAFSESGNQEVSLYVETGGVLTRGFFQGCVNMVEAKLPTGFASLGQEVFSGCTALTSVTIPDGITAIDGNCFSGCTALTGVTIPGSVTDLGIGCFYGCSSISNIVIPNGVSIIRDAVFNECTNLKSIRLPGSITAVSPSNGAFYNCNSLTSITIYATTAPRVGDPTFRGIGRNGILIYPAGSDYSSWLGSYPYLGYYGWTGQEI